MAERRLRSACFIGEISQPAAIGREAAVVLANRHVGGGGRLEDLAVAGLVVVGQGQNPIGDSFSRSRSRERYFPSGDQSMGEPLI
jgi:hypothetical protein